ncbi:MAG: hypothetical protein ABIS92_04265, partial [Polyangia bacterium]
MPWQKMTFRNDQVWVLVDEAGKPVLDRDGRAEMKYREADTKSYRPGPANLTAAAGAGPPRELASAPPRSAGTPSSGRATGTVGALEVWTDGACSGNPGPMGIGVVVIDGDWRDEISEYLGVGTNNI